jgi:hypothetical protein
MIPEPEHAELLAAAERAHSHLQRALSGRWPLEARAASMHG